MCSFTLCASRTAGVAAGIWLVLFGVIGKVSWSSLAAELRRMPSTGTKVSLADRRVLRICPKLRAPLVLLLPVWHLRCFADERCVLQVIGGITTCVRLDPQIWLLSLYSKQLVAPLDTGLTLAACRFLFGSIAVAGIKISATAAAAAAQTVLVVSAS